MFLFILNPQQLKAGRTMTSELPDDDRISLLNKSQVFYSPGKLKISEIRHQKVMQRFRE